MNNTADKKPKVKPNPVCEDCQQTKDSTSLREDLSARLCAECYGALGGNQSIVVPRRTSKEVAELIVRQAYALESRKDLAVGKLFKLVKEHRMLVERERHGII